MRRLFAISHVDHSRRAARRGRGAAAGAESKCGTDRCGSADARLRTFNPTTPLNRLKRVLGFLALGRGDGGRCSGSACLVARAYLTRAQAGRAGTSTPATALRQKPAPPAPDLSAPAAPSAGIRSLRRRRPRAARRSRAERVDSTASTAPWTSRAPVAPIAPHASHSRLAPRASAPSVTRRRADRHLDGDVDDSRRERGHGHERATIISAGR